MSIRIFSERIREYSILRFMLLLVFAVFALSISTTLSVASTYVPNSTGTVGYFCSDNMGVGNPPLLIGCDLSQAVTSGNLDTLSILAGSVNAQTIGTSYPGIRINFSISENAEDIVNISIQSNSLGSGPASTTMYLYLWNFSSSKYEHMGSAANDGGVNQIFNFVDVNPDDFTESGRVSTLILMPTGGAMKTFTVSYFELGITAVDSTLPAVSLTAPQNGSSSQEGFAVFNATVSDNTQLANATFYLWNSSGSIINQTVIEVNGTLSNVSLNVSFPYADTFLWNYEANDTSGNSAFNNTNYTFTYTLPDTTAPNVTLSSPANGVTVNVNSITLAATFSDAIGLATSNLFVYNSTGGVINSTRFNISGVSNSSTLVFTVPALGVYSWNYEANDTSGNSAFASANFTFTYAVASSSSTTVATTPAAQRSSSSGYSSKSYSASSNDISEGASFSGLWRGDVVNLKVAGGEHSITINDFDLTVDGGWVNVTIASTPQTIVLEVGEEREIDLNGDGVFDLFVRVDDIIRNRITLFVEELAPESEPVVEVVAEPVVEDTPEVVDESSFRNFWVFGMVLLACLIGIGIVSWKVMKE